MAKPFVAMAFDSKALFHILKFVEHSAIATHSATAWPEAIRLNPFKDDIIILLNIIFDAK